MSEPSVSAALKRRARLVNSKLTSEYGRKSRTEPEDPLDTLIETILSQNTSDLNSGRAFQALKDRYSSWSDLLTAPKEEVARTIRSGGLADIKAGRIKGVLAALLDQRGVLSLDFLGEMDAKDAEEWLVGLEGVGPKTAAIVLLFSLGKPAFPVDTHVFRVSGRLGLTMNASSREKAQKILEKLVPPEEYYNMHINIIEHGRRKCRARNPLCHQCLISRWCEYFRARGGQQL